MRVQPGTNALHLSLDGALVEQVSKVKLLGITPDHLMSSLYSFSAK